MSSSSRRKSSAPQRRVASVNTSPRLPFDPAPNRINPLNAPRPIFRTQMELFPVEDLRRYHPEGKPRSLVDIAGRKHGLKSARRTDPFDAFRIAFQRPERLLVCIRRHVRKEVMFAKKHAGKSGQRKPRRTYYSSISCKG